jgi:DNA polymerase-3 subunit alpha
MQFIFDLETTGFPERLGYNLYPPPSRISSYDSSRIVQIAYILYNSGKIIKKFSCIIFPENFVIENSHIHGITQEKAIKEGKKFSEILPEIIKDISASEQIISHNLMFDLNILLSEIYRIDQGKFVPRKSLYCTMENAKRIFSLRKVPKLTELFSRLYPDKNWVQRHDAMDDVLHCLYCYVKLKNSENK